MFYGNEIVITKYFLKHRIFNREFIKSFRLINNLLIFLSRLKRVFKKLKTERHCMLVTITELF